MHHYRNDETDIFYGEGAPSTLADKPCIYIDRTLGRMWVNLGGGSTWYSMGISTAPSGSAILTEASTRTAADYGKTFFLGTAGGFDTILPALTAYGFRCKFKVLVAPTTAYTVTGATADKIVGHVLSSSGGAEDHEDTAGGDVVNFIANTSVIGDELDVQIDPSGTYYFVSAKCAAAGGITITG